MLLAKTGPYVIDGDPGALSYHITLSYLWVLGAYEILRSIHQRCRDSGKTDTEVVAVLRKFERLRMPLAKYEAADRHKATDSKIAYPAINSHYGVAWEIALDVYIPRGELSNDFLGMLERKVG